MDIFTARLVSFLKWILWIIAFIASIGFLTAILYANVRFTIIDILLSILFIIALIFGIDYFENFKRHINVLKSTSLMSLKSKKWWKTISITIPVSVSFGLPVFMGIISFV